MLDYKPNIVLSNKEFKVVGTRPIRHDGWDKVTGRARYANDVNLPGMLVGKILRSPHAHAIIKKIDYSKALKLPGVQAVVTADDLPNLSAKLVDQEEGSLANIGFRSRNILAREKVLYIGHAIAAVAATSQHIAEEALSLIEVEYEVLTPVITTKDAMKADAPILHELLVSRSSASGPGGWGEEPAEKATNIANHFEFKLGDVDEGFKGADLIVEREFHTKRVHQGYIEPHAATASWGTDGYVTIWTSTQQLFGVREDAAKLLGLPTSKVKIIPMEIGGGFGGKGTSYLPPVVAMLSKKTGKPVKIAMGRAEVFAATGPTSSADIKVKIGVNKEGRITAAEAHLIYEAGAFPGSSVGGGARCMFAPYDIPNGYIEAFDVLCNTPKVAAYRAPGAPMAAYAAEQVIDELCQKLAMDPLEFRLLNAPHEGSRQVTGPVFAKIGYDETLKAAREHAHYSSPLGGPNRGRGVATGFWGNGSGPASAIVNVNSDGTVSLIEGAPDIGGSRAAMAMQVAEALGLASEDIRPSVGDTDSIGFSTGAGGSSVTQKVGAACYLAAQDVKQQMIERAAKIWDIPVEEVEFEDGVLQNKSDQELRFTFKDLAARLNATGGPISGRANLNPGGAGAAFAINIVDVEVDPETGKVEILRFTAVQDVGKAIHPSYVEGQIQGAAVQGIGWALNEEYYYSDKGQMMNASFLDYRMPVSLDLPMIDTVLVEVANPGHPYGVRGVGEVSLVPTMGAIANAIQHATGVRMTSMPMSPGRIMEESWKSEANKVNGGS
ncbi:MAG: xanthine dehydrogenase family protein molybdopterin-binding subunit [Chloroflexi bacterium]|nr:xanthine dehydrogenase family protein molybdopterin-binding subunit [Chloroflexota bacterium]